MRILGLIIVILVLSIIIWKVWEFRTNKVEKPELTIPTKEPELPIKPKINNIHIVHNDRMALLAIVNNNNMAVVKYGYPRKDIMFINEDWTIDRIPPHVQLNKDDEIFVRKFLKQKEL